MVAFWPLLAVTRGALSRSTPFCWLSARMTTWNCGSLNTPAMLKMPGATAAAPLPISSASMALAEMPYVPERLPAVTGLPPTTAPNRC